MQGWIAKEVLAAKLRGAILDNKQCIVLDVETSKALISLYEEAERACDFLKKSKILIASNREHKC